jgi:hypothetical protein
MNSPITGNSELEMQRWPFGMKGMNPEVTVNVSSLIVSLRTGPEHRARMDDSDHEARAKPENQTAPEFKLRYERCFLRLSFFLDFLERGGFCGFGGSGSNNAN